MTRKEVQEKVVAALMNNTDLSEEQLDMEAPLMESLGLTSLKIMLILAELEETCSIQFTDSNLHDVICGNDVIECILQENHSVQ